MTVVHDGRVKTRERKDAEIVAIATGLLLGIAVVLAGGAVLYVLRHSFGVGNDVIDPLVSARAGRRDGRDRRPRPPPPPRLRRSLS